MLPHQLFLYRFSAFQSSLSLRFHLFTLKPSHARIQKKPEARRPDRG